MKELNAEAYVSCLTLISASGSSFIAIHLGQELMGGCSFWERACSDWDRLLALTECWHSMSDIYTQRCKSIEDPQRCFSFHFPLALAFINSVSLVFLIIRRNVGQECGQAGRQRRRVLVRFKDDMSKSQRLWCFLAGFRRQLTIWWSGSAGLFKSPGPSWPQSSSPPVTNALIWQG